MNLRIRQPKHHHPIFNLYKLSDLAEMLDYQESYLIQIRKGTHPANRAFRNKAALILRRPVDELFAAEEDA